LHDFASRLSRLLTVLYYTKRDFTESDVRQEEKSLNRQESLSHRRSFILLNDSVGSLGASGQWTRTMRSSSFQMLAMYPETTRHRTDCTQRRSIVADVCVYYACNMVP